MAPIIIIILLALLSEASKSDEKRLTVYTKNEKPLHYVIPDESEEEQQKVVCVDNARPYVVLSARDKKHLERIISQKHDQTTDPNLMP